MTCLLGGGFAFAATTQPAPTTQPMTRAPIDAMWRMPPDQVLLIEDFTRAHMPNLYRLTENSPSWRRVHLIRYAYARMLTFNQSRYNSALSEKVNRDIQSEDAMFALVEQWENASGSEQPVIHDKIREQMRQVVDNLLQERTDRLERLKERIADEERTLQEDRNNRDAIVDNRVERLLGDSSFYVPPTTNPAAPTTMPAK
jgi:hypothetical protein